MKKLIYILTVMLCTVLAGCGNKDKDINASKSSTIESIDVNESSEEFTESTEPVQDESSTDVVVESSSEEQPLVESVVRGADSSTENGLIKCLKTDLDVSSYSIDTFSDTTKSQIVFGVFPEEDAVLCYALANKYFDTISTFEITDWVTTVHYDNAWCYVVSINNTNYKFVISETAIFMTDVI